jgi:hypothetical protein
MLTREIPRPSIRIARRRYEVEARWSPRPDTTTATPAGRPPRQPARLAPGEREAE